ncbi:MAG: DUF2442 domain-containing protein [Novosphingobium sp.]
MNGDRMRTIEAVEARGDTALWLRWSDSTDVAITLKSKMRAALGDPAHFAAVKLGDWGHSVEWPNGSELGADSLWLETLTALGRDDARQFLEWRLRNNLSLSKAAEELGLSRRTIVYYSNGDRPVPKAIQLACQGWDALHHTRRAA